MRALLTLILGVILAVTATVGAFAASDRRVALVIGNSAYRKFPSLPNPRNDAEDVTAALKRAGFTVVGGTDMTRQDMRDSLRQFARAAQDAEAALVYYAGHGCSIAAATIWSRSTPSSRTSSTSTTRPCGSTTSSRSSTAPTAPAS